MSRLKEYSRNSTYGNDWPEATGYSRVDRFADIATIAADETFPLVVAEEDEEEKEAGREIESEAWEIARDREHVLAGVQNSIAEYVNNPYALAVDIVKAAYAGHFSHPGIRRSPRAKQILHIDAIAHIVKEQGLEHEVRRLFRRSGHAKYNQCLENLQVYLQRNYGRIKSEIRPLYTGEEE